jgi:hypothetical protein
VPIVQITTAQIVDWPSFHDVFANALGFPEFYGRNMNAWVDCLTYADEDDGMRNVVVPAGEVLTLELDGVASFAKRCPEQYAAVVESSAFVNWRRIEQGERPIVALSFWSQGVTDATSPACASVGE